MLVLRAFGRDHTDKHRIKIQVVSNLVKNLAFLKILNWL